MCACVADHNRKHTADSEAENEQAWRSTSRDVNSLPETLDILLRRGREVLNYLPVNPTFPLMRASDLSICMLNHEDIL